jgi:thiol:disulfide interchange protein
MKKRLLLSFVLLAGFFAASAQTDSLLHWQAQIKKTGDGIYELYAKTIVPQGWYVFSNNPAAELDGVKFVLQYENATLLGPVQYISPAHFVNDGTFGKVNVFTNAVEIRQVMRIKGFVPKVIKGTMNSFIGRAGEFYPSELAFELYPEDGAEAVASSSVIKLSSIDIKKPVENCGKKDDVAGNSVWGIFLLGFLGGLIALLTPCVFPMIPVTVSFFTKKQATANRRSAMGCCMDFLFS